MTTTTTADALLAAVLANPGDDAPRLIYADHLEERDGPGDAERAEFVRVQVELARLEGVSVRPLLESARTRAVILDAVLEYQRDGLRRRERELLQAHYPDWLPRLIPGEQVIGGPDGTGRCIVAPFEGVWFRRGFVEQVACPLETWTGAACRWCRGTGDYEGRTHGGRKPCPNCSRTGRVAGVACPTCVGHGGHIHVDGGTFAMPANAMSREDYHRDGTKGWRVEHIATWSACPNCHGTPRTAGVGAALVACQPVTTVRVTDREPFGRYTAWSWWDAGRAHASDEHPKSNLPTEVFALLRGGRDRMYDSEAAALADLSAALIRLAKGGDA